MANFGNANTNYNNNNADQVSGSSMLQLKNNKHYTVQQGFAIKGILLVCGPYKEINGSAEMVTLK